MAERMTSTMAGEERRQRARAWLTAPAEAGTTRVKLCGMSREEDVDAVMAACPDLCGFIVDFPKSHRNVSPERVAELTARMDAAEAAAAEAAADAAAAATAAEPDAAPTASARIPVWRVGVFVDEPALELVRIVRASGLDLVQLHGHEDAAYVEELRALAPELGLIQAFKVRTPDDVERACASPADLVLLDNGQGTGEAFDWSLCARAARPFMLAGGLAPENVASAIRQVRPWGVDMSSGIETGRVKDPAKIQAAVAAVRGVKL